MDNNIKDNTKNENKILDCVLLLNGNFIIIKVLEKEISVFESQLLEHAENKKQLIYAQMQGVTFKVSSLVGWYFRKPPENPMDEIVRVLKKEIPNIQDIDDGDEWKHG